MSQATIRVIVAGSRHFQNQALLEEKLDKILERCVEQPIEIISGGAEGADQAGEAYAQKRGLKVVQFPANWKQFGKQAGFRRNEQMAKYATHLVAFWDGKSSGTRHMIETAKAKGLPVRVILLA